MEARRRWVVEGPDADTCQEADRLLRRAAYCDARAEEPASLALAVPPALWARHARYYRRMAADFRRVVLRHRRRFPGPGRRVWVARDAEGLRRVEESK